MEDSELELRDELIENYSQARKEDDLSQPKSLTSRIVIKGLVLFGSVRNFHLRNFFFFKAASGLF